MIFLHFAVCSNLAIIFKSLLKYRFLVDILLPCFLELFQVSSGLPKAKLLDLCKNTHLNCETVKLSQTRSNCRKLGCFNKSVLEVPFQ